MKKEINKWEDCGRDDLNMIPLMIENGFTPEFSSTDKRHGRTTIENVPHDSVSFVKGDLEVWKCYDFKTGGSYWQTARLVNGHYTEHSPIDNLSDLFKTDEI